MWAKVAEEMAIPWRAAEAMHWQLGEADMARRAGVVPFSLSNVTLDAPPSGHRSSPGRGHSHSHSHGSHGHSHSQSIGSSSSRYGRAGSGSSGSGSGRGQAQPGPARTIAARRDSTPRSVPPASPSDGLALAAIGSGAGMGMGRGGSGGGQYLPSVAEMTTGVSPYSMPAYSMGMTLPTSGGGYSSPGMLLPSLGMYSVRPEAVKRRGSPDMVSRETSRRRQ